jgi:membrane associated rhomboid family serine protease
MSAPDDEHPAWIERVVAVAKALGANPVRVRWKLVRWVDARRAAARRRAQAIAHVRYEHAVCPSCHAVNPRGEEACTRCGAALRSRPGELVSRLGVGGLASATVLLALAIVAAYVRIALAGHTWASISVDVLAAHGGDLPRGVADDEPWRYLTAIFLHVGMWHLAFNLLALAVVGPRLERAYGAAATLFVFVATGAFAAFASQWTGLDGVGAGASGAIMGLIGAVAAEAHRSRTTIGRAERNAMLRWAAYTVIVGVGLGADNRAHVAGFVAGAAWGLAIPPELRARRAARVIFGVLGAIGVAATALAVTLVMWPPAGGSAPAATDDPARVLDELYMRCEISKQARRIGQGPADVPEELVDDAPCVRLEAMRAACRPPVLGFLDGAWHRAACVELDLIDRAMPRGGFDPDD